MKGRGKALEALQQGPEDRGRATMGSIAAWRAEAFALLFEIDDLLEAIDEAQLARATRAARLVSLRADRHAISGELPPASARGRRRRGSRVRA